MPGTSLKIPPTRRELIDSLGRRIEVTAAAERRLKIISREEPTLVAAALRLPCNLRFCVCDPNPERKAEVTASVWRLQTLAYHWAALVEEIL